MTTDDPVEDRPDPQRTDAADDELTEDLADELAGDVVTSAQAAPGAGTGTASVLRSSMLMSAGTVASRFGGVLRGVALAAALGAGTVADAFTLGNTLPNVVYILIIGGALNAVFIPELVRHMKDDPDDGVGYADRLITLVSIGLAVLVVAAVVFAPFLVRIYATPQYTQQQLDLAIAFARFCLPQIFFYGAYTMLSQVLNARGHFGAPMFAPLVNNIVAIATFVLFIVVAGPEAGADGVLEPDQVALLGIGTTLGVVMQALVLVPVLRRAGYRFRPSRGFRGAGLSVAGSLAAWTIGLVLVNQIAYAVIVRLATGVNAASAADGATPAGLTAYTNAHLMFVLPHSVITVSLVAALLPRMSRAAHDLRYEDLAADIAGGMRSASALIIPASVALVVLGTQAGILLFNYGQTSTASAQVTGLLASVFALGLLPFTLYYIVLRGWYALERTRTAFWVTVVLNVLNLAIAVPLYRLVATNSTGPAPLVALTVGYVAAYWLTLVVGWVVLSRQIGGLQTGRTIRALGRMSVAGLVTFVAMAGGLWAINQVVPGTAKIDAVLRIVVLGALGGAVYLLLARLLRITEVTEVLATLRRRIPVGR